jgi:hypothetical protein
VPQQAATVPGEQDRKEREAVLARLKARVDTYQAEHPAPPPVFPAPKPEYAPAVPQAASTELGAKLAPEPERLRTYSEDFATRIDTSKASAFSVYAAQADSGTAPSQNVVIRQKQGFGSGFLVVVGGATLVIGGSLILYFAYNYLKTTQPVPVVVTTPPALVSGEDSISLSGADGELMSKLVDAVQKAELPVGSVRIVYLQVTATTSETGGALINALRLPAPDILLRNLGESSTVGIVHAGNSTDAFFVLAAASYERTFAGMLAWEATIGHDLALLYPPYPDVIQPVATTTAATSTPAKGKTAPPPALPPPPVPPHFVDEAVDSHDVRALKDGQNRTILLYGYRDQNTLVIARDETAFSVLLARLSATQAP